MVAFKIIPKISWRDVFDLGYGPPRQELNTFLTWSLMISEILLLIKSCFWLILISFISFDKLFSFVYSNSFKYVSNRRCFCSFFFLLNFNRASPTTSNIRYFINWNVIDSACCACKSFDWARDRLPISFVLMNSMQSGQVS